MAEDFDRASARLRAAISRHEEGHLDHAGLQEAIAELRGALAPGQNGVLRHALFEADVTLEYAVDGRPGESGPALAQLRRMRRNLREALR